MTQSQESCDRWVAQVLGLDPAASAAARRGSATHGTPLFSAPSPPGGPTQGSPTKPDPVKVRKLQQSISKWLIENGGSPISDSGNLDDATKKAIPDFQRQSGLHRRDGIVGPETEARVAILLEILQLNPNSLGSPTLADFTSSAGFGSLDGQTQDEALRRIKAYAKPVPPAPIATTLDNIRLLKKIVMESGFEQLSNPSKKLLLNVLAARADDMSLADNLDQLVGSPDFRKLDEATQKIVLNRIKRYGGNRIKADNIENMVTATLHFGDLSKETQNTMLNALANHPADTALGDNLRRAVEGTLSLTAAGVNFSALDQATQTDVLIRIQNYPRDTSDVDNLMLLTAAPGFLDVAPEVRDDVLDGIPERFQNTVMTPAMISNLLTLLRHPVFEKIQPLYRRLMLDLLSGRPDNAQLAAGFVTLMGTPGFQHDHRTAEKRIHDVDAQTP
jgi:peptidoglycan hydrolase-like protein with peptidoglycan-binding domain